MYFFLLDQELSASRNIPIKCNVPYNVNQICFFCLFWMHSICKSKLEKNRITSTSETSVLPSTKFHQYCNDVWRDSFVLFESCICVIGSWRNFAGTKWLGSRQSIQQNRHLRKLCEMFGIPIYDGLHLLFKFALCACEFVAFSMLSVVFCIFYLFFVNEMTREEKHRRTLMKKINGNSIV